MPKEYLPQMAGRLDDFARHTRDVHDAIYRACQCAGFLEQAELGKGALTPAESLEQLKEALANLKRVAGV